jgi:Zn-dependent M16 (insulinase) family peptidase
MGFAGTWLHGGDPARILKFDNDLKKLRESMKQEPFFENLIKKWLLTNNHRSRLTMVPDEQMEHDEAVRVQAELEKIKKSLSLSRLKKIHQYSKALQLRQETPDDVSCLPTLTRKDIPSSVPIVKETENDRKASTTLYSQPTSGIFYFAASAGTGVLPRELISLAPFFCYALTRSGTSIHDYTEVARRIDAYTGGIGLATHARTRYDEGGSCLPFISFGGKCLVRNQEKMFEIIQELITRFDFGDHSRLKNLLNEYRAGLQSMIVHNGHRLAISAASRNFSPARALSESWSGIHQLKTIKQITDKLTDKKIAALSKDLSALGTHLFARNNFQMALIGEEDALSQGRTPGCRHFRTARRWPIRWIRPTPNPNR